MSSSYYDVQSWHNPSRQSSWDQPPSRSGASSTVSREETVAFGPQFEDRLLTSDQEVDRAIDNLLKSGKLVSRRDPFQMGGAGGGGGGGSGGGGGGGRPFAEFDPRIGGGPSRHPSMDYDPMRSHSASGLQNFYGNARYPSRGVEADPMQQAKRRMAAQRERDLRNYHQEQQYNRSMSTQSKSERSMSPNAMNDDDRRELIARQHKALYGNETSYYDQKGSGGGFADQDSQTPRPGNPPIASAAGGRGPSPMAYGSFAVQDPSQSAAGGAEDPGSSSSNSKTASSSSNPQNTRSRTNSNSSPASNTQNFGVFDQAVATAQQSSRTSTSSPGGSPPRSAKAITAPAPIGTRPAQAVNPALNKRTTPPASSPLSFGFAPNESNAQSERTGSAASNPAASSKENAAPNMNWGTASGVWGKSTLGGVSSAVWG